MDILRKLYIMGKPHISKLILAVTSMFILTGLGMIRPYLAKIFIDDVIKGGKIELLPKLTLSVVAISLLRGVFHFMQYYFSEDFGQRTIYDLRNALYQKLQGLSWTFYDDAQTGQLMSRLTGDIEGIRVFLSGGIVRTCDFVFMIGDALFILFAIDWKLTLVTLSFLPFLAHAVMRFDKQVRPAYSAIQQEMAVLTAILQENVTGVRVVKAFAQEPQEIDKFSNQNGQVRAKRLVSSGIWSRLFPYMGLLSNISSVFVLLYGGVLVLKGEITLGSLVAFTSYIWVLIWPIREIGWLTNLLEQALASGARVWEILGKESRIRTPENAVKPERLKGHVKFECVSFSYPGNPMVLKDIELDAPPGKVIGILGGTGSGKTSLMNLLGRFYDVTKGRVLIDGIDVRHMDLLALRQNIGYVLQETFLFSASIRDNISYGRPEASLEDVKEAAVAASAHDFIMEMPQGYDTIVGERGIGLSGGQKQRIALARAFLKDPPILVLDDPTSSVDMETEKEIQKALKRLFVGRTTFIIAHRISSLMDADEIIVLDAGRVVERGNHQELLAKKGIYRQIYEVQFKDREDLAISVEKRLTSPVTERQGE